MTLEELLRWMSKTGAQLSVELDEGGMAIYFNLIAKLPGGGLAKIERRVSRRVLMITNVKELRSLTVAEMVQALEPQLRRPDAPNRVQAEQQANPCVQAPADGPVSVGPG